MEISFKNKLSYTVLAAVWLPKPLAFHLCVFFYYYYYYYKCSTSRNAIPDTVTVSHYTYFPGCSLQVYLEIFIHILSTHRYSFGIRFSSYGCAHRMTAVSHLRDAEKLTFCLFNTSQSSEKLESSFEHD